MAVITMSKHKYIVLRLFSVYVIQDSINTRDWAPPAPMSAHRIIDEFKIVMFTVSLVMGFAMGDMYDSRGIGMTFATGRLHMFWHQSSDAIT
jgi:hypothetical protein